VNELQVLEMSQRYMELARQAGIVPREMNAAQIQTIILAGRELGLQPLQSLRTMSFINGRLVMAVQLQLALARQRAGVQVVELTETENACTVTLARGSERVTCTYTMQDAERAGLLRGNNWRAYPRQMLRWRAIGDALRVLAPDVVAGLLSPEEAETLPPASGWSEAELQEPPADAPVPALDEPEPHGNGGNGHDHEATTQLAALQAQDRERYNRILRALQAHARRVFADETARREWLHANYGVWSFRDLSIAQAREALQLMQDSARA